MGLTNNHRRSIALAKQILSGEQRPENITDADWALLMLAADINRCDSAPSVVARRVLDAYEQMTGYFDPLRQFAHHSPAAPVEAA